MRKHVGMHRRWLLVISNTRYKNYQQPGLPHVAHGMILGSRLPPVTGRSSLGELIS